jgi:hypothetical protein
VAEVGQPGVDSPRGRDRCWPGLYLRRCPGVGRTWPAARGCRWRTCDGGGRARACLPRPRAGRPRRRGRAPGLRRRRSGESARGGAVPRRTRLVPARLRGRHGAAARSGPFPVGVDVSGAACFIDLRPGCVMSYLTHRRLRFPVPTKLRGCWTWARAEASASARYPQPSDRRWTWSTTATTMAVPSRRWRAGC